MASPPHLGLLAPPPRPPSGPCAHRAGAIQGGRGRGRSGERSPGAAWGADSKARFLPRPPCRGGEGGRKRGGQSGRPRPPKWLRSAGRPSTSGWYHAYGPCTLLRCRGRTAGLSHSGWMAGAGIGWGCCSSPMAMPMARRQRVARRAAVMLMWASPVRELEHTRRLRRVGGLLRSPRTTPLESRLEQQAPKGAGARQSAASSSDLSQPRPWR